ncbi:MAG: glutamate dehydrogenase, partial [bacterium]
TVAVQGLGNVGYWAAKIIQEAGGILVAIAEYDGAIHDPAGLDVDEVQRHREASGSILNAPGSQNLESTALALEYECDILIPAALERQITSENAGRINARIVAEAANGPVTSGAERILKDRGVMIIPDLYLNAGGVTVSYFEWLKNLSHVKFGRMSKRFEEGSHAAMLDAMEKVTGQKLTPEERAVVIKGGDEIDLVRSGLEETMYTAYDSIRETCMAHDGIVDLRTAAFVEAIDKIAISYMQMGIFP